MILSTSVFLEDEQHTLEYKESIGRSRFADNWRTIGFWEIHKSGMRCFLVHGFQFISQLESTSFSFSSLVETLIRVWRFHKNNDGRIPNKENKLLKCFRWGLILRRRKNIIGVLQIRPFSKLKQEFCQRKEEKGGSTHTK